MNRLCDDKAQNDRRVVPNVGKVWRPLIRQEPLSFVWLQREFIAPQLRERVELKVGWPTVKVPFVMVWGFECSFLSFFILNGNGGGQKLSRLS